MTVYWVLHQLGLIFQKNIGTCKYLWVYFSSNIAESNVYLQDNLWKNSWLKILAFRRETSRELTFQLVRLVEGGQNKLVAIQF